MKWRIMMLAAVAGLLAACSETYQATDTGTITVSRAAHRAFIAEYPEATNVVWGYYDPSVVILNDWEMTGWTVLDTDDYAVRFKMDGEDYYAWYDSEGTWIGTAYVVKDHSKMPAMIHTSIRNLYPAYTIYSVNREFYADKSVYEVTLKNDKSKVVLLVDNNGNILKSKVKTDD